MRDSPLRLSMPRPAVHLEGSGGAAALFARRLTASPYTTSRLPRPRITGARRYRSLVAGDQWEGRGSTNNGPRTTWLRTNSAPSTSPYISSPRPHPGQPADLVPPAIAGQSSPISKDHKAQPAPTAILRW